MQRAIHNLSFGRVYGHPKQRDVLSSIEICIQSIYFAVFVGAFEHLVRSFANAFTGITGLGRIGRWSNNQRNTVELSLVRQVLTKLIKIPLAKFSSEFFVPAFTRKSYARQIFNRNPFVLEFGRLNNLFGDCVIYDRGVSTFFAREPFKKFSRRASAFALNRTPNLLPMFTIFVKPIGRKLNIIRGVSHSGQAKISYKIIGLTGMVFVSLLLNNNVMAKDRTEYLKEYHKRTYVPIGNKQGRPTELPQYDFSGIYQLKNTVNEKIYIGQAQNILNRFNDHRRNRNGHLLYRDCYLYRAIKKYGWGKFEISVLEKVDDVSLINEREIFWINKLNPEYNMKDGGDCARGWKHSEKAKRKMSETKSKMYLGENNPFFGKTHSKETKEKIRKAKIGKKLSKAHREKISKSNKSHLRGKKVVQLDLEGNEIRRHKSVSESAKNIEVNISTMFKHLKGKNKTCKGYVFRYA